MAAGVAMFSSRSGIFSTAASSTAAYHQFPQFMVDNPIISACAVATALTVVSSIKVIRTGKDILVETSV